MKKRYKVILIAAAAMVVAAFSLGLASCGTRQTSLSATTDEERQEIEYTLNLAKNQEVTWSYDSQSSDSTGPGEAPARRQEEHLAAAHRQADQMVVRSGLRMQERPSRPETLRILPTTAVIKRC